MNVHLYSFPSLSSLFHHPSLPLSSLPLKDELVQMELEIESLKSSGADGFVFGILTTDGHVDAPACQRLVKLCAPLPCTFHRAFDVCAYWPRALSEIRSCGFSRVLSSGQVRAKYWATRSSVRSFARTAHSFACFGLLASLAPSASLPRSLPRSLRSLPRSWDSE